MSAPIVNVPLSKLIAKCQLSHLMGELREPAYVTPAEQCKKSELVEKLAKLFEDAAEGRLEDAALAQR